MLNLFSYIKFSLIWTCKFQIWVHILHLIFLDSAFIHSGVDFFPFLFSVSFVMDTKESFFYLIETPNSRELLRVLKKGSNPQEEKSDLHEEKKNPQEEKKNPQEEKANPKYGRLSWWYS